MENFGMLVILTMVGGRKIQYQNVTEIHYGYEKGMIALESDIHLRGITIEMERIQEMEVTPESCKAPDFK